MKNKWENANFLITAKKCIDSFLYISKNALELSNLNLREKADKLRQNFYINLVNVLDEFYNTPTKKKVVKQNDKIIDRIYYERNKNSAHKDDDYKPRIYNTLEEEIQDKKNELLHVKELCSEVLPDIITIDFVPHDKELFRLVNRINATLETDANKIKYPNATFHSYQLSEEGKQVFKEFDTEEQDRRTAKMFGYDYDKVVKRYPLQSIDDIRIMSNQEKQRYAVIMDNGINSYEGLQNRQDSCIKINVLFDLNMWCEANKNVFVRIEELKKLGFLDVFEIPHLEILNDERKLKEIGFASTAYGVVACNEVPFRQESSAVQRRMKMQ